MRRPANVTALALLAAAVVASQLLLWWFKPPPKPRVAAGPPRSGYTLEDFKLVALGDDGRVDVRLRAPHLKRRDGDGSLYIDQPKFELPAARGATWHGDADYAWIAADGDEMRLQGKVQLSRPAAPGVAAADIATANLTVLPDSRRLSTKAPTVIREPGRILHGTGMQADLNHHTLELLADVHGTFETRASH